MKDLVIARLELATVDGVLVIPKNYSRVGLTLPQDLTIEEWGVIGEQIQKAANCCMWWLGDWWAYGEHAFGEEASQKLGTGYAHQTFKDAAWVSRKIEPSRRRDTLSWAYHREVAALDPEMQDRFLDLADSNNAVAPKLTIMELRKLISRTKYTAKILGQAQDLPDKKYNIILADPPWTFGHNESSRSIDRHYPTMEVEEIKAFDVGKLAEKNCILFLWTTASHFPGALEVMATWGFEYRTHAVWVKPAWGMGHWFRQQHEPLLLGVKGDMPAPLLGKARSSVIEAPTTSKHSEKPHVLYEIIEESWGEYPKIELFARGARDGWDAWGNEAPQNTQMVLTEE